MAWKPDYATSASLKVALNITDAADDAAIALAITASSRAIDAHCNRQFGSVSSGVARYFRTIGLQHQEWPTAAYEYGWAPWGYRGASRTDIEDVQDATGIVVKVGYDPTTQTFATTLGATDYRLGPWNAAADGVPWTWLHIYGTHTWDRLIEVTAKWGWTAVPKVVEQACLLQAARVFKRKDAPFGVAGSPDIGSELRLLAKLDPDVAVLLSGVRRHVVA